MPWWFVRLNLLFQYLLSQKYFAVSETTENKQQGEEKEGFLYLFKGKGKKTYAGGNKPDIP